MYINGRFLTQPTTGVQRFAREMIGAGVGQRGMDPMPKLLTPVTHGMESSFSGLDILRVGKSAGHVWEQLELPRAASQVFLVNLCNAAPISRRQQLVVLHDAAIAAIPQNFTPAFRAWYQVMIRAYGYLARKIATVSHFSAGEITRYFGIAADKIEVISSSGEHILKAVADYSLHEQHELDQDGYFLAVSSLAPHKNFEGVLKAVALLGELNKKFVIVGGRNMRVFNSTSLNTSGAIEAGYVSDGQLRALYERAACFVYPSFYEGFGLPPLEAMACGCPVLVSNVASLPEVCGDGARYCNPYDPSDISRQLFYVLESRPLRAEMREAGFARAKHWSWAKAATQLNEIIARIA